MQKSKFARPSRAQVYAYIRRLIAYVIGMFFIASGVTFSRSTNWGISTVNSIPNVLSLRFPRLTLGTWVIIVFTCFILVQALILLRRFKWYSFLQLLSSTLFGFFVDGTDALYGLFLPQEQAVWLKIVLICVSTVVIAFGIFLYLEANILSMPGEGVTVALSQRTGLKVSTCKIIFDVSIVTIACILSLLFFRDSDVFWTPDGTDCMLRGVGIGTVVIAVFVGVVMKPIMRFLKKPVHALLFGKEPAPADAEAKADAEAPAGAQPPAPGEAEAVSSGEADAAFSGEAAEAVSSGEAASSDGSPASAPAARGGAGCE